MNVVLRELVELNGGLVTFGAARQVVPAWTLRQACVNGDLVRVLPQVFVAAHLLDSRSGAAVLSRLDPALGQRAVLAWADGRGALSHLSALSAWGLRPQAAGEPLHLSTPVGASLRTRPGLVVHRHRHLRIEPPHVVVRRGLTVTRLDQALVDSWPMLPSVERRAPVIRAVNDWLTTPERLAETLDSAPKLIGRATFRTLLTRLADGCRSPLEIWGHEHVFTGPAMPAFRRQVPMRLGRRTVYLDMFAERERVNIELDGATTHGDPRQREIDLRRDALLATVGILVVRFAHRRLVHEADDVRRETLAILAARRATQPSS
ncbi:endonuclease domain-containing protein [Micromonospora lupini]|uniref:endonuclease domain-containing protein n=1 Tax=Micromonospora lupini TaxID=285679 RepID=UPI0031DB304F